MAVHPAASLETVTIELYKLCIKWGWIVPNLIVNIGSLYRAVSNIGLCSASLAPLTQRHDLNSRRGLVSDLKWETGHVLDYVVKSKRCVICARQTLDPESEEYAK